MVSPSIRRSDLPGRLTVEHKIAIFEDRVLGWQLGIAEQLYYGATAKDGGRVNQGIRDNGFAALYIVLSYFEAIQKYVEGSLSDDDSGVWFKKGIIAVFPEISGHTTETSILFGMWKGARNGLYHATMTGKQVFISDDAACLDYDGLNKRLVINPGVVTRRASDYFRGYISSLSDPINVDLRVRFEKRFDKDILPQIV